MRFVFKIQGKMVISILGGGGGGQLTPGELPVAVHVPVPVLVHSKKNASPRLTSSIMHS